MVKCINPLFSNSAHGKVGGLVYQTSICGQMCRVHVPQRKRPSQAQKDLNYAFGVAADKWRVLTEEEKQPWIIKARGLKMTGYNLFIKENIIIP